MNKLISTLIDKLNTVCKDIDINIEKSLLLNNIKTRTKKIKFSDAIYYKFISSYNHTTNKQVVADISFTNVDADNSSYYRKEQKIPLECYHNILNNI